MEEKELNRELKNEELEKATGGSGGEESRKVGGYVFYDHVDMYSPVAGQYYYILVDSKDLYCQGLLKRSTEEEIVVFGIKVMTKRVHIFSYLTDCNDWGTFLNYEHKGEYGEHTFYGSDVTLYKSRRSA